MEYDIHIETIFYGIYRNWNYNVFVKTGVLEIYALERPGGVITIDDDIQRIGITVDDVDSVEDNPHYFQELIDLDVLNFKDFEKHIGCLLSIQTKKHIKEVTSCEGLFFDKGSITVQEMRI